MRHNILRLIFSSALCLLLSFNTSAQNLFSDYSNLFVTPLSYVVMHTSTPPVIDGNINDKVWADVEWTELFQDIEGRELKPDPIHKTRVKMLWDDEYIYFAAELEEPHVWAYLSERDDAVMYDNDFEIFIDPSNTTHRYFEIQINALNNIFDLYMNKPYRNGGSPLRSWDTPGMVHAVDIDGSLNKTDDIDKSWSVEMAVPFSALYLDGRKSRPANQDVWRMNFLRIAWETDIVDGKYVKVTEANGRAKEPDYHSWSPQGIIDMHYPERWGYLQFSTKSVGEGVPTYSRPYSECQRDYLWLVYYKQRDFMRKNGRYAQTLKELSLPSSVKIEKSGEGQINNLSLQATDVQFSMTITDGENKSIEINDEGLVRER